MGRCNGIFMHRIFIPYILSILLAVLVLLLMEEMVGTVEKYGKGERKLLFAVLIGIVWEQMAMELQR